MQNLVLESRHSPSPFDERCNWNVLVADTSRKCALDFTVPGPCLHILKDAISLLASGCCIALSPHEHHIREVKTLTTEIILSLSPTLFLFLFLVRSFSFPPLSLCERWGCRKPSDVEYQNFVYWRRKDGWVSFIRNKCLIIRNKCLFVDFVMIRREAHLDEYPGFVVDANVMIFVCLPTVHFTFVCRTSSGGRNRVNSENTRG